MQRQLTTTDFGSTTLIDHIRGTYLRHRAKKHPQSLHKVRDRIDETQFTRLLRGNMPTASIFGSEIIVFLRRQRRQQFAA